MTAPVLHLLLRVAVGLTLSSIVVGSWAAWVDAPRVVLAALCGCVIAIALLVIVTVIVVVEVRRGAGR